MCKLRWKSFLLLKSIHDKYALDHGSVTCLADFFPQASDLASTSRLLVAIITISKDSGDWGLLNEQILLLSKKHGQLKQATTKMVQVAMSFIDETPDAEKKLGLIETLRTVTEGKVRPLSSRYGDVLKIYRYSLKWSERASHVYYPT